MSQSKRIMILLVVLAAVVAAMLGVDAWRRSKAPQEIPAGHIPVYVDGRLESTFGPADLEQLDQASFVDAEEGKTQEGWLLRDVLELHVPQRKLKPDTEIVVSSSSREKSVTLTWAEVEDLDNNVLFDLSGRGTLKLVSTLERLDIRDEWVQDVDHIEVNN